MTHVSFQNAVAVPMFGALLAAAPSHSDAATYLNLTEIIREASGSVSSSIFLDPVSVLNNTVLDCFKTKSETGWDGYGAKPITQASRNTALALIAKLPRHVQRPDVLPSAAGGYSLEWFVPNKVLSIEIENEELSWSFVDADKKRKQSGYEATFNNELPAFLTNTLIREFLA